VGEGVWGWLGDQAQAGEGSRIGSWTGTRKSLDFWAGTSRLDRGFGSAAGVLCSGSWIRTVVGDETENASDSATDESFDSSGGLGWTGRLGSGSDCDRGAGPGETLTISAA